MQLVDPMEGGDGEDRHKPIRPDQVQPPSQLVPAPPDPDHDQESPPEPGSKGMTFKIKIKMPPSPPPPPRPQPAPGNLHGERPLPKDQQQGNCRACEICGKVFTSGKAWGGHKRHHLKELKSSNSNINNNSSSRFKKPKLLQPPGPPPPQTKRPEADDDYKNVDHFKNKAREEDEDSNNSNKSKAGFGGSIKTIKASDVKVSNGGMPSCCLCGKRFPSMNALFGHMRFHPDRGWKGTKPPTKHVNLSASTSTQTFDVHVKNTSTASARWPSGTSTSGQSLDDPTGSPDFGGRDHHQISADTAGRIAPRIDLMGSLPLGWPKKDTRGRVGSLDYTVPEAARSLLDLSRDAGGFSGKGKAEKLDDNVVVGYGKVVQDGTARNSTKKAVVQDHDDDDDSENEEVLMELKKQILDKRKRKDHGEDGENIKRVGDEAALSPLSFQRDKVLTSGHGHRGSHNRVFEFDLNKPPQGD